MAPHSDSRPFPWKIDRAGRAWTRDEWEARRELTPEKIELSRGKLFWTDDDRLAMLALMLENVGVDQAIKLGDPEVWRAAIAELGQVPDSRPSENEDPS
jgi:hypothetical protein